MCKHVLNAQVSIRAPCCKRWFDCAECHAENSDHQLARTTEMTFLCKSCKKAFRKDMSAYEESDEYCPYCDNHYVLDAKTPENNQLDSTPGNSSNPRVVIDERMASYTRINDFDKDISELLD